MEEASDQEPDIVGVRGDSGESGEGSDVEGSSWDGLLIEDEDEEAVYYSEYSRGQPKSTKFMTEFFFGI